MEISFTDPLVRAWRRMVYILFAPFDLVKWLLLAFSAWIAGLARSCNWPGSRIEAADPPHLDDLRDFFHYIAGHWERLLETAWWLPVAMSALAIVVAAVLAVLWVSSRGKFIFLDNVIRNRAEIVVPWQRMRRLGNSLFIWRVAFAAVCTVFSALLGSLFVVLTWDGGLGGLSLAAIGIAALAGLVFSVVAALVLLCLDSFVVPIMYQFNLSATAAWRYLVPWLAAHAGWFMLYAILVLVASFFYFLGACLLCLGTCSVAFWPYVDAVLMLWLLVAFRLFSIEFLAQFHPDFNLTPAAY